MINNLTSKKSLTTGKIKVSILNLGECSKCSLALTSFLLHKKENGFKNISQTNNPEDCNCLLITGCLLKIHREKLLEIWQSIKKSHIIISFGDCGTEKQKRFNVESQNLINLTIDSEDLSEVIPIDYIIEGCPPQQKDIKTIFQDILEQNI